MENQDWRQGLRSETIPVFETVSQLEVLKGLYLCGGTAQSLQLLHRKSEDLDFELLGTRKERPLLDFSAISNAITDVYPDCRKEFLGRNQLQIFVNGNVKLSFFRPENAVPELGKGFVYNNIVTPSLQELLGMKLFTIAVRSAFRDYYDIYALLKAGYDLEEGVAYAGKFSRHNIHSKTIYGILLNDNYFRKPTDFSLLEPKYDVSTVDIADYIKQFISEKGIKIKH
ncbi:MAG: nucleotidyl transferase AbiEii/AbiGii toxin family protein [Bacteroidales bacterium]|jgi:predicted nucleotidyltransferase component of viral defense system|nr:nucleotidyl transferase AbiEii/AbiGii toxin family protein [Bacteroidales bacterium]